MPGKYVELPELVAYQAFGQEVNRFDALLYVLGSLYFQFPVVGICKLYSCRGTELHAWKVCGVA